MSNTEIKETLELMCDKNNPQDRKLLLLADLVDTKCNALAEKQDKLKSSLDNACTKIDKLTDLLEAQQNAISNCPVNKDRGTIEKMILLAKNPKMTFFAIIGSIAIIGGMFGSQFLDWIRLMFK